MSGDCCCVFVVPSTTPADFGDEMLSREDAPAKAPPPPSPAPPPPYGIGNLDEVFEALATTVCPKGVRYGIGMHPSQVRSYAHFSRSLRSPRPTICEIGFSCGHSTATFLEANPSARVVNFDLPTYPWNRTARAYHRSRYGPRLEVIDGNSLVTIREFSQRKPTPSCDMVVVDGMHDYVHPLLDILGLLTFAPCNASIVMDDVCDPRRCHAHFIGRRDLGSGANNHVVIGPTQAWREAIRTGHVREVVAYNEPATGGAFDRGWALGEHVCDRHGERTRPRRRYSYTPVMVTFQPNHPSGEQSARDTKQRAVAKDLWGEAQPTKKVPVQTAAFMSWLTAFRTS